MEVPSGESCSVGVHERKEMGGTLGWVCRHRGVGQDWPFQFINFMVFFFLQVYRKWLPPSNVLLASDYKSVIGWKVFSKLCSC